MKNAVFTICSINYLAQAQVLVDSIYKFHDDLDVFIIIVDEPNEIVNAKVKKASIIYAKDLNIENFFYYAMKFNVIEFNTFVKPFVVEKLLKDHDKVLYMDPDIAIFSRLDVIFNYLDSKDICLTPHCINSPCPDYDNEMNIRMAGHFNMGFGGFKASKVTSSFLHDWQEDLKVNCYSDIAKHQFTDQKSVAFLFYTYFENTYVINNPGCNFAPWNFMERSLAFVNSSPVASIKLRNGKENKEPLVFFHFSGFNVNGGDVYFTTKHAPINIEGDTELKKMLDDYRESIKSFGYDELHKVKYAYNYFSNERYISRFERRVYELLIRNKDIDINDDSFNSESNFYHFLKKKHLLTKDDMAKYDLVSANALKTDAFSKKAEAVDKLLRMSKRVVGLNIFLLLMKYMTKASRNDYLASVLSKVGKPNE